MITLPFPHKSLWPNGRANHFARAREAKKHRAWAHQATLAARPLIGETPTRISWVVYPHATGPAPDKDNAVSATKAYQDGICDALGINDRTLEAPHVIIAERVKGGRFVAVLT